MGCPYLRDCPVTCSWYPGPAVSRPLDEPSAVSSEWRNHSIYDRRLWGSYRYLLIKACGYLLIKACGYLLIKACGYLLETDNSNEMLCLSTDPMYILECDQEYLSKLRVSE